MKNEIKIIVVGPTNSGKSRVSLKILRLLHNAGIEVDCGGLEPMSSYARAQLDAKPLHDLGEKVKVAIQEVTTQRTSAMAAGLKRDIAARADGSLLKHPTPMEIKLDVKAPTEIEISGLLYKIETVKDHEEKIFEPQSFTDNPKDNVYSNYASLKDVSGSEFRSRRFFIRTGKDTVLMLTRQPFLKFEEFAQAHPETKRFYINRLGSGPGTHWTVRDAEQPTKMIGLLEQLKDQPNPCADIPVGQFVMPHRRDAFAAGALGKVSGHTLVTGAGAFSVCSDCRSKFTWALLSTGAAIPACDGFPKLPDIDLDTTASCNLSPGYEIPLPEASKCECGAHKSSGIGRGKPGHSSWCPWRAP